MLLLEWLVGMPGQYSCCFVGPELICLFTQRHHGAARCYTMSPAIAVLLLAG